MTSSTKQTLKNTGGIAPGAAVIFGKVLGKESAFAI